MPYTVGAPVAFGQCSNFHCRRAGNATKRDIIHNLLLSFVRLLGGVITATGGYVRADPLWILTERVRCLFTL